jgi:hypothetical protein
MEAVADVVLFDLRLRPWARAARFVLDRTKAR